jgi:transcriptional regulator with XRE-family HTH domain
LRRRKSIMAIAAYLERQARAGGRRRSARRKLRLPLHGTKASGVEVDVLVHNISATGMLLESHVELEIGDGIEIGLPHAGASRATIIWASGPIYGCQFDAPISLATLSAAQLRSVVGPDVVTTPDQQPPAMESFGVRLRRLRAAKRLTQAQIATELGVSVPSISAWEQDKARPKAGRMDALAIRLGVDVSELLGIEETDSLTNVVASAKAQVARAAAVSADKVKIIIEI